MEEKNSKRKAWIATVLVQVLLFLLVYYAVAWRAPDPPNPEYGIELSFLPSSGGGSPEVGSPEPSETQPAPTESAEPSPEQPVADEGVVKASPQTAPKNSNSKPTQTNETKINQDAVYNPNQSGGQTQGQNNPDAIYSGDKGGSGSGSGSNLSMAGWNWDRAPRPNDTSSETGKIVYSVTVDGDGYLVGVQLISSTVSPEVERIYRREVEKLTFTKTSGQAAATSKGTITFVLKSR